jgi:hypothetical protein
LFRLDLADWLPTNASRLNFTGDDSAGDICPSRTRGV